MRTMTDAAERLAIVTLNLDLLCKRAALAVAFVGAALLILATSLGAHAAGLIIAGVGLHCAGATASAAGA